MQDGFIDLEKAYAVNMHENVAELVPDVFFGHLLEMTPLHITQITQQRQKRDEKQINKSDSFQQKFIDPRTKVEIPTHLCNYKEVDAAEKNVFLRRQVEVSKLQMQEHSACLGAMLQLSTKQNDSTPQQRLDRQIYDSTENQRTQEKNLFLEKLREIYFKNNFYRFHWVSAAIDHFVRQIWKRRLIELHRNQKNCKYRLQTAFSIQKRTAEVKSKLIFRKTMGNVPESIDLNVEYIRQSSHNLLHEYNQRKNFGMPNTKLKDFLKTHDIDVVIPMSILRLLLIESSTESIFCVQIKDLSSNTSLDPKKQIVIDKPLPPLYLSGRDRCRKAAKYLVRSCFCKNSRNSFNIGENVEKKSPDEVEFKEFSGENVETNYNICHFDTFMERTSKKCLEEPNFSANKTYSVFEVSGPEDENDETTSKTLKVLIPAKQDAYIRCDDGETKFLNFSPKIEYQAEYGAEAMTKDELIREWCQIAFGLDSAVTKRGKSSCF